MAELNKKCILSLLFLAIIVGQHSPLFAQQVNEKVLALRKEAANNIASMVAGVPIDIASPLKGIISPIKKSADPKVFYNHVLDSAKQSVLAKFETFGISAEELELDRGAKAVLKLKEFSQTAKRKEAAVGKPASSRLRKKARAVFKLFTDKDIPLLEETDSECSASANDDAVFITQKRINPYLKNEKDWTFGHEVVHLLEKHASEEDDVKVQLQAQHGELTSPMKRSLLELSRCNEARADIKAVLTGGLSFALGYERVMLRHRIKNNDTDDESNFDSGIKSTHPADIHRHKAAQLLSKELSLLADIKQ